MSHDYSENILVQESAGQLLERELGWEVAFAYNTEKLGEDGSFGRKSYKEILLTRYFREALLRLNPWITPGQMEEAQKIMQRHLSTASLLQINEEKYFLIRDGIPVTVKKPGGRTETKNAVVIDFQNPGNNHFLAIKELKIHGDLYRRRTDIVGFVNGLPLLFVELKKNTVDVRDAYTNNYTDYLDTIPHLFYYNAFLILSNGTEAKVGTLGSKYDFSTNGSAFRSRTRAVWPWKPCCGVSARRKTFWIYWKTSFSMTIPVGIPPKFSPGTTSISGSTRRSRPTRVGS